MARHRPDRVDHRLEFGRAEAEQRGDAREALVVHKFARVLREPALAQRVLQIRHITARAADGRAPRPPGGALPTRFGRA